MPAFRNMPAIRRSRRLSKQPPQNGEDWEGCELAYPSLDGDAFVPLAPPSPVASAAASPAFERSPSPSPPPAIAPALLSRDYPVSTELDYDLIRTIPAVRDLFPEIHASTPATTAHSRKHHKNHVRRPANAFICFRSHLWNGDSMRNVETDHRDVSRIAAGLWRKRTSQEQLPFRLIAEEAKLRHARKHPEYKYAPVYRKEKAAKRVRRDSKDNDRKVQMICDLLENGVEGSDLENRMKGMSRAGPSAPRRPSRSQPKARPPVVKQERSATPNLARLDNTSLIRMDTPMSPESEDEFVPLDEIPHLDLGTPVLVPDAVVVKCEETPAPHDLPPHKYMYINEAFDPLFPAYRTFAIPADQALNLRGPVRDVPFISGMPSPSSASFSDPDSPAASSSGSYVSFTDPFTDSPIDAYGPADFASEIPAGVASLEPMISDSELLSMFTNF